MLVLVSAVSGACDKLGLGDNGPTAPGGPPAPRSAIVYDVIGASDASGIGSSAPCAPLTECANGMGYAPVAARELRAQGFDVSVMNHGIPTAVISQRFQALGQQYDHVILGNFISQQMPSVRPNSTLVTIFAGVNEVNIITAALGRGAGGADPVGYIDAQVAAFAADYRTLIDAVRSRSTGARIVVLNVPNVAALPSVAGAASGHRAAAQRAAVGMSAAVNALRTQGLVVLDVMCDARSYLASNYSRDGLHPNDAGYAYMAGEIVRAVTATGHPAPQSSCGFMSVAPSL